MIFYINVSACSAVNRSNNPPLGDAPTTLFQVGAQQSVVIFSSSNLAQGWIIENLYQKGSEQTTVNF